MWSVPTERRWRRTPTVIRSSGASPYYPHIHNRWTTWGDMPVRRVRHQAEAAWFHSGYVSGYYPGESRKGTRADRWYPEWSGSYLYAFRHGIETFIKYNYFHNEETDGMYCPMGQRMERLSDARRITNNGFVQTISRYKARNYKGCPLRCRCYRNRSERIVQVNHRLRKIKEREREKLLSDEGLKYRSQRPQDVEAVFGNLKNNKALQEVPSSWI